MKQIINDLGDAVTQQMNGQKIEIQTTTIQTVESVEKKQEFEKRVGDSIELFSQKFLNGEVGEFPMDALPPTLKTMAMETANVHQIAPTLPAIAGITCVSAACGNRFKVVEATNGRETLLNLYTVAAAPKSYGKGASASMLKPIQDYSQELQALFKENELPQIKSRKLILEKKKSFLLSTFEKKTQPTDEAKIQNDIQVIEKELEELKLKEISPTLIVGNTTTAALEMGLSRNNHSMFCFSPEAGDPMRIALGKFNKGEKGDFDLYLMGYSNELYQVSRITRGDHSFTPTLCVFWMVQPCLLEELFTCREAKERGLTARMLVATVGNSCIPYDDGIIRRVSEEIKNKWNKIVRRIIEARNEPRTLICSPEAREVIRAYHNEGVDKRNGDYNEIEGELGRYRENAIRLAGVLCVADRFENGTPYGDLHLEERHAQDAVKIMKWFNRSSLNLISSGLFKQKIERFEKLIEIIQKSEGKISVADLKTRNGFDYREIDYFLKSFEGVMRFKEETTPKGGRPSKYLELIL